MTANLDGTALALVYVGSDFGLYYRYAADGKVAAVTEKPWGSNGGVIFEPSTTFIWDGGLQVYAVQATTGSVITKAVTEKNLGDANSGWYTLGGRVAGSPVSTYYDKANKRIELFAVGMNGQVYGCYYNAKWTWELIPVVDGKSPVAFEPERINVSSNGERRIDLVGVSVTNDLYHRYYNGSQWSHWTSVGMNAVGSRPVVWTTGAERVDIICKDARDHKLYHTASEKGVWLGWQLVSDTQVRYDPSGCYCTDTTQRYHIAAASIKGALLYSALDFKVGELGTWASFQDLGGVISASPKITHRKGGIADIFARGMDSNMYHNSSSPKWSWQKLGGNSQTKPC